MNQLLLLSLLVFAAFADYECDGDVMVLTEETFDQAFNEFDYLIHCKELASNYAETATTLRSERIVLTKIDATVQKKTAEEYDVKGYPTIKFNTKSTVKDFQGCRRLMELRIGFIVILILKVNYFKHLNNQMRPLHKIMFNLFIWQKNKVKRIENWENTKILITMNNILLIQYIQQFEDSRNCFYLFTSLRTLYLRDKRDELPQMQRAIIVQDLITI